MLRTRLTLWALILLACLTTTATADDALERALGGTYRFIGEGSSATGFVVRSGERLFFVTAGHVLEQARGNEGRIVFREHLEDQTDARREQTVPLREGNRPLWYQHASADVAALPIESPPDATLQPFDAAQLATAEAFDEGRIRVADDVWIPGFPAQLEGNEAGWPVVRRGGIATHPLRPIRHVPKFLVNAMTFGGDSGAPVLVRRTSVDGEASAETFVIAGMILGMVRQTDRTTTPFEERIMHTPLGLGIVLPAPPIREVIDQAVAGRPDAPPQP